MADATQLPWASDSPPSCAISGHTGVKAKRPMPMAAASASAAGHARLSALRESEVKG
ncbi:hypothetical protein D3C72_2367980 [compost metagenome]